MNIYVIRRIIIYAYAVLHKYEKVSKLKAPPVMRETGVGKVYNVPNLSDYLYV